METPGIPIEPNEVIARMIFDGSGGMDWPVDDPAATAADIVSRLRDDYGMYVEREGNEVKARLVDGREITAYFKRKA